MSDTDLNNLTAEDLKLITKLAYRISKKGFQKFSQIALQQLHRLQKYPNGYLEYNSKFNGASRQHKIHIPEVKKSIQNDKKIIQILSKQHQQIGLLKNPNVKKFFQDPQSFIKKMRSQTFQLNCPENLRIDKKFAVHSFQNEFQKLVNPKLKYGQQQLKSLLSEQNYQMRKRLIKELESQIGENTKVIQARQTEIKTTDYGKPSVQIIGKGRKMNNRQITNKKTQIANKTHGQQLTAGMKSSLLFSSGFSLLVNIKDLVNGNYLKYFGAVALDTGIGASHCVLNNSLKSVGKAGGLISSITIGTVLNVAGLIKSGDWDRFGLSTGATVASSVVGFGGYQLGAAIGSLGGPVGVVVGGIVGGIIGGFLGNWGFSQATDSHQPTRLEKQQMRKVQLQQLRKIKKELNDDLKKIGQKVDEALDIEVTLKNGQIGITQKSVQEIYKIDKGYLTKPMIPYYKQIIRPIVAVAKGVSPTGNVTQGLRILIQMTQSFE